MTKIWVKNGNTSEKGCEEFLEEILLKKSDCRVTSVNFRLSRRLTLTRKARQTICWSKGRWRLSMRESVSHLNACLHRKVVMCMNHRLRHHIDSVHRRETTKLKLQKLHQIAVVPLFIAKKSQRWSRKRMLIKKWSASEKYRHNLFKEKEGVHDVNSDETVQSRNCIMKEKKHYIAVSKLTALFFSFELSLINDWEPRPQFQSKQQPQKVSQE